MIFTGAARRTRTISGSLGRWNPATRSRRRLCCDSSGPGDRSHRLGPIAWLSSWRSRKSGSAARRAGLSLRKAPGSPPGGSDLPLHRLPENSPVEAVTLGALSRALVQVVMFTLSTPVPAKFASRGGHGCPARLHGRGFRTGSDRVPVGFRAVSHSQDPIIIRRFRSPARAERGRILSDRYVTSSRQRIPAGFPGSDVKVRAVGCLCAGVDEQPRGVACPHAAAPPWWQEGLVSEHHDHPRARGPGPVARRSGLPERAGARVLSPRVPRGRLRNAPCPSCVTGLVVSPTPSSARTITGRVRILTRSRRGISSASARRTTMALPGTERPPSMKLTCRCVVPARRASSSWLTRRRLRHARSAAANSVCSDRPATDRV
jgi:hypothetical protein